MSYWINVVSRDHVQRGVEGGFTQANHGKPWALKKMKKGDWIIFYSPKTSFENGEPLQAFTALCQVTDDEPYQVEVTPSFSPWRRNVRFERTREVPIKPLIEELDFIENKVQWGYKFRFGVIEIGEHDFQTIKKAMSGQNS
ncbi:MAG TPA: EVE domain-containing protein [Candidatus Saccharimonadales bacterium]|nr:EVE domain-containing protein [Candidatus Saccharimonadales bacterium]